jgi:hypothetical protein
VVWCAFDLTTLPFRYIIDTIEHPDVEASIVFSF